MEPTEPKKKQAPRGKFPLIPASLALALVILLLPLALRSCAHSKGIPESRDSLTDGLLASEEILPIPPDMFKIRLNATPTLDNGVLNLRAENVAENEYACRITIVLTDGEQEGRTLYASPLIPPGKSLDTCAVPVRLPQGVYSAVAKYILVDPASPETVKGETHIRLELTAAR